MGEVGNISWCIWYIVEIKLGSDALKFCAPSRGIVDSLFLHLTTTALNIGVLGNFLIRDESFPGR